MQFLTSLFGGTENTVINAILALGIVLVLIVLGLWVLKLFFRASTNLSQRNRRVSVVDSVSIDSRRQLIIVRRDNVEHLILTGGPQDLVVETGIAVDRQGVPLRRPMLPQSMPLAANSQPERPAPSAPVNDALEAAQALVATVPQQGPMERLRELSRTMTPPRKSGSLRHTGLMRPVSRMEPAAVIPMNPDNSDRRRIDSAKTGPHGDSNGQAELGEARYQPDGAKAEHN